MSRMIDQTAAVRAGEELDLARLERFLRKRFPSIYGPLAVEQFPSGHSNLTYLLRLGDSEMVLRRPPFGSTVKTAHDMGREFRVLSKLHPVYSPAPEVLAYCDDESVLGTPFYLMRRIVGTILRREIPAGLEFGEKTARGLSESFVDNLIHLHSLDYEAIGLGDLGKPAGYLQRQVSGWIDRYHKSATHDLPEVAGIVAWLTANIPASGSATLIHNDYKYDNIILATDDLTRIIGVLDWEMCTIGDPLSDLGCALAYWVDPDDSEELLRLRWGPTSHPGSLTRRAIVERYAQSTGSDVSNIAFYLSFGRFKLAVILQQIYYRYHHGLTKDQRFAALPALIAILMHASTECAGTSRV